MQIDAASGATSGDLGDVDHAGERTRPVPGPNGPARAMPSRLGFVFQIRSADVDLCSRTGSLGSAREPPGRRGVARMSTAHARRVVAIALAAIVGGACAGDNEVADLTTVATAPVVTTAAPTTSDSVDTTVPETDPATTEPATTAAVDTTVADDGPIGPMFSDALGVPVDSAPGVHTRGDTRQLLPEGLYVHIAWEADPDDPSVFTVQPDDIEILEAYANASLAYYRAALTTLDTSDPAFDQYFVDGGAKYEANFAQAKDGNYVVSLGSGVVLRPYVTADSEGPDSAVVLDCYLQNEQFIQRGSSPELSDLVPKGTVASMVRVNGTWKVDLIAAEPEACL
ncbi:MAG: hypothetical protein U0Q03_09005 [Acidimicrobiales bacterium]